jgi:hypothetical protein
MDTRVTNEPVSSHDAFISYSRKDSVFARRLEQALENYRPPKDLPVPQRRLDVFRDEEDFIGTEYSRAVEQHLAQSKKLLLLCSPASCASRYVDDEIRRFLRSHDASDVIPVLLSGIPNNEATAANDPSCAFPPALVEALEIPLAADFRGVDAAKSRLDRGASAGAWYSVLANLYGQSRSAIEQRELRRQARSRRITGSIVGGIIVSLSVALAVSIVFRNRAVESAQSEREARMAETKALGEQKRLTVVAEESRDEALRQRAAAEREAIAARRETASRLAVQTSEKLNGAPEQALHLGIDAIESFHRKGDPLVPAAIGALQKATLAFGLGAPVLPQADPELQLTISEDLRWAAQSDAQGNVRCGPVGSDKPVPLAPPPLPRGARWEKHETALAFQGDRLIAVRPFKTSPDKTGEMIWYWRLDARGGQQERVVLDRYEGSWPPSRAPISSNDGRWIAWSDGWDTVRMRALSPHGKTLSKRCSSPCRFAFSGDSRLLLVLIGSELDRVALSAEANAEPVELAPLQWSEGRSGLTMDVYAGDGPAERDADGEWKWGKVSRVAVLTEQGLVHWWNLTEAEPAIHSTANLMEPYRERLELQWLSQDHLQVGLDWNAAGSAVIASVKRDDATFGLAAVSVLLDDPKWQPLWHRYDGKATETSSRSSNSSSENYRVLDSGDLGVDQAIWYSTDAMVTLGFDGSVWFRDLEKLNRFQLVARNASAIATLGKVVIVGGRDGGLGFVDDAPDDLAAYLNGHDAPVASIRLTPWHTRLLSVDARGVARAWNLEHPVIGEWLDTTDGASTTISNDGLTLITHWLSGRVELRDSLSPNSLVAPRVIPGLDTRKATVAVDPAGRWIGALDVDANARLPLRLRLWKVGAATVESAPLVRRFARPKAATGSTWALSLRSSATRVIAELRTSTADSKGDFDTGWVVDSRDDFATLNRLGRSGARLSLRGVDTALRWMIVVGGSSSAPPKRHFIIDLEQADAFASPVALPAKMTGDYIDFDPGGQWLRVGLEEYKKCLVAPAAPQRRCIALPRDLDRILFGPGRSPLVSNYDGEVAALDSSGTRFRPVPKLKGSTQLAWDESGRWLAASSAAGGVQLYPVDAPVIAEDAIGVRLPDPAQPAGDIDGLFPYVAQRWIFATTSDDHMLCWYRDDAGHWSAPVLLPARELREAGWGVSLRNDGHVLVVGLQAISLDPERLVAQAKLLMSGRP